MHALLLSARREWRQLPLVCRVLNPPIYAFIFIGFVTHVAGFWGR